MDKEKYKISLSDECVLGIASFLITLIVGILTGCGILLLLQKVEWNEWVEFIVTLVGTMIVVVLVLTFTFNTLIKIWCKIFGEDDKVK